MADFEQINEARQLLGLGEAATLKQIKAAYKRQANRYHPDRCKDPDKAKCDEMMKRINQGYELIIKYCAQYSYSFGEEALRFSPTVNSSNLSESTDQESHGNDDTITIYADSVWIPPAPSVKPSTTMYPSLAFPGWGQIDNGEKKKAALFFIAEIVCIGGYLYKNYELRHGDYTDWEKENELSFLRSLLP